MYEDQTIHCSDCNDGFAFTAGEQEFYATRGYSAPQRCKDCRAVHKANYEANKNAPRPAQGGMREMHDTVCSECNKQTKVPFKPIATKPVYCLDCFKKKTPARA